jgi:hypothetical protein
MQQKQQDTLLLKLYYGDEKEVRVLEVRISSSLSLSLCIAGLSTSRTFHRYRAT